MLTSDDDVGFALSDVRLAGGSEAVFRTELHRAAHHIVSGTGEVTDVRTGQTRPLGPSMAYSAGPEDHHRLRAHTDMNFLRVTSL